MSGENMEDVKVQVGQVIIVKLEVIQPDKSTKVVEFEGNIQVDTSQPPWLKIIDNDAHTMWHYVYDKIQVFKVEVPKVHRPPQGIVVPS